MLCVVRIYCISKLIILKINHRILAIIKTILENREDERNRKDERSDLSTITVLTNAVMNARKQILHAENSNEDAVDVHVGNERAKKSSSFIEIDHRIEDIRAAITSYRPPL